MYWPIPYSVCINSLYPTLGPAKLWAPPYPHNYRYPQTSTFSPNHAHKIKAAYTDETCLARTPPVHRQARRRVQRVHHHGEMGGGGTMQQTPRWSPTSISLIKACISSMVPHAR
ncbi:hypothetical protein PISMIDRAFT_689479 [Pisolithus microcarpus 441]|uniref:Uncharacterized protein n=1 Tax=Pisolithus microcarpus 441 TaxID=765257 RepID=A0A0C9Y657_9AGAM|nr:hypothetical protein BKA83DRAFT_689479 [Pisolithus microcarpus]KIK12436.1 hypothetical protein PISMIDRAFT_689479 [Pisolithus microcarpus 441]